tara:strand:- start:3599 stop:4693 length:1095 start_codon:yes stop_codon:yes gene_type:complete
MQSHISDEMRNKFASNAYIANKAYELSGLVDSGQFEHQSEIPLFTSEGAWETHQVMVIQTEHKGLDCYICVPQNSDNTHIKICFTGVYDEPSAYRVLDPLGSGYTEFSREHPKLLEAIKESIQDLENVTLEITGHSLGGADANHLLIYLLNDHLESNSFSNVSSIECTSFNAPGSNYDTTQLLQEKLLANALSEDAIKIIANIGYSEGDWVQQAGYQLYNNLSPDLIDINFVKQTIFSGQEDFFQDIYMMMADDIARIIGLPHKIEGGFFAPDEPFGHVTQYNEFDYFSNQIKEQHQIINEELSIRSEMISMVRGFLSWLFVGEVNAEVPIQETIQETLEPFMAQQPVQDILVDPAPSFYEFDI